MTPLLYAARDGRLEAARLLVAAGANLEQADANGITPLLMAALNNQLDVARLLLSKRRQRQRRRLLGPHAAVGGGRVPQPRHEQPRRGQPDRQRRRSRADPRPDQRAARHGRRTSTRARAKCRRSAAGSTRSNDVSWVDFTGQTPFLRAALSGDTPVMRLLLRARRRSEHRHARRHDGADGRGRRELGRRRRPTRESPQALLEAVTALPRARRRRERRRTRWDCTALLGAANRGSDDIIELLVEAARGSTSRTRKAGRRCAGPRACSSPPSAPERKPATIALLERLTRRRRRHDAGRMKRPTRRGVARLAASARGDAASSSARRAAASARGRPRADHGAARSQYCVTCHNARTKSRRPRARRARRRRSRPPTRQTWEKVVRKLRTGMMPPAGAPRPERARARRASPTSLETALDRAAAAARRIPARRRCTA